jgi:hypothetical protein
VRNSKSFFLHLLNKYILKSSKMKMVKCGDGERHVHSCDRPRSGVCEIKRDHETGAAHG